MNTKVTILCLHKITDKQFPSWPGMSVRTFEKLLKYITKHYKVCLPNEISEKSKRRQLILSFDDGFEDFYINAFPLLKKHKIPAVLNVVVNCIKTDYQIWTQRLNDILDIYAKANSGLELEIENKLYKFEINIKNAETIALEIFKKLLPLQIEARELVISKLEENTPGKLSKTKMMSPSQLKEVSDYGILIGSHSLSHPNLKIEDTNFELLKYELLESKIQLENLLNKPVEIFAFPNGMYSELGMKLAEDSGYKYLLLVDNNVAEFNLTGEIEILDRILIYSNNHFKNIFRIEGFHNKIRKWLK
ncbi:MAG: polysaccharide deacetylase family protein [Bacteroidales bacterium]|nr:polysaccharide deacetylase family protein [Bacteroidales bacterium]